MGTDRRTFIKSAGIGLAAAGLTATTGESEAAAVGEALAPPLNRQGDKEVIRGKQAVASSQSPIVTQTMLDVLAAGGNAVDATVAGNIVQATVQPEMTNHTGTAAGCTGTPERKRPTSSTAWARCTPACPRCGPTRWALEVWPRARRWPASPASCPALRSCMSALVQGPGIRSSNRPSPGPKTVFGSTSSSARSWNSNSKEMSGFPRCATCLHPTVFRPRSARNSETPRSRRLCAVLRTRVRITLRRVAGPKSS